MKRIEYLNLNLYVLSFGISLLFLGLITNRQADFFSGKNLKEISIYLHPIKTLNPESPSFEDLSFLKEVLKEANIVLLGEQLHGDGATILAKSRLVNYLHLELGFEVLAFEANLFETYQVMQGLSKKPDDPKIFTKALYPFWCQSVESQSLISHIQRHINSPQELLITGIDIKFSGRESGTDRLKIILNYLNKIENFDSSKYKVFIDFFPKLGGYVWPKAIASLSQDHKDHFLGELEDIYIFYRRERERSLDAKIFEKYLFNLYTYFNYKWRVSDESFRHKNMRDSLMAENLIWLADSIYPQKKIIVWAANAHILFNTKLLEHKTGYIRMGDYIKNKYGESCYTINFTSYAGVTASNYNAYQKAINQSACYSIEYLLHKTQTTLGFINFRQVNESSFLTDKITLKCLGHTNKTGVWSKMTDGLFYIDTMSPIHFNR